MKPTRAPRPSGDRRCSLCWKQKDGKAPKVLQLSGTPYNLMQKYENNVYTWDYVMEQKRKREWDALHPGDHNPYADLPELRILTFDLGKRLPTSYRYETLEMAFNFTEFSGLWTGDPRTRFSFLCLLAHRWVILSTRPTCAAFWT